jgi:DNA-cytosine methyltransferase
MNVLSLFDGMSCGQIALNRIGVTPGKYYAAEIDRWAIQVTQANYPNTIQLGSVTEWRDWDLDWSTIDFVSGGFPCQAWSMAGKQLGDKDERGMLFWVMLDIMKHAKQSNPKIKFLIENVKMKKEFEDYITHHTEQALGEVNKVLINSALVSAQNRNRFYWTNWHVEQPEDKGIVLADIIEQSPGEITVMSEKFTQRNAHILRDDLSGKAKNLSAMEYVKNGRQGDYIRHDTPQRVATASDIKSAKDKNPTVTAEFLKWDPNNLGHDSDTQRVNLPHTKHKCLVSSTGGNKHGVVTDIKKFEYRKLTPTECERLQTVPDGYTKHVSNTQRYKMLGNGWTVDVIAHIYSQMELPIKVFARQLDLFEG